MEFPASAPRVIQEAIKFPQSNGLKEVNARMATRTQDVKSFTTRPRVCLTNTPHTLELNVRQLYHFDIIIIASQYQEQLGKSLKF